MGGCCSSGSTKNTTKASDGALGDNALPDSDDEIDIENAAGELPWIPPSKAALAARYGSFDLSRGDPGIIRDSPTAILLGDRNDGLQPEESLDPAYISRGPGMRGKVEPCVLGPDASLFRVIDGHSWALYNDSCKFEITVRWTFVCKKCKAANQFRIRELGDTKRVAWKDCEPPQGMNSTQGPFVAVTFGTTLEPGETKRFVRMRTGHSSFVSFEHRVDCTPQRLEVCKRLKREADSRVMRQYDEIMALGATKAHEALRTARLQSVPFVDLAFRANVRSLVRSSGNNRDSSADELRVAELQIDVLVHSLPLVCFRRPEDILPIKSRARLCTVRDPCSEMHEPYGEGVSLTRALAWYYTESRRRWLGAASANLAPLPLYLRVGRGSLGDSWLTSAMAVVAERPALIKRLFATGNSAKDLQIGAYCVTLCVSGWWTPIYLDSYLPHIGNVPVGARNDLDPSEMWPSMTQKAFAKQFLSYTNAIVGDATSAIYDLCGYPIQRFDKWFAQCRSERMRHTIAVAGAGDIVDDPTIGNDLFFEVLRWFTGGTVYGDAIRPDKHHPFDNFISLRTSSTTLDDVNLDACGLAPNHTYAVVDVKYFPKQGKRLLRIRNPWPAALLFRQEFAASGIKDIGALDRLEVESEFRWRGDWSWTSPEWTSSDNVEIAIACGYTAMQDFDLKSDTHAMTTGRGSVRPSVATNVEARLTEQLHTGFWMEWCDVLKFFSGGSVCFVRPKAHEYRILGTFAETGVPNVALELRPRRNATMLVTVSQTDKKSLGTPAPVSPTGASRRLTRRMSMNASPMRSAASNGAYPDHDYMPLNLSLCRPNIDPGTAEVYLSASPFVERPSDLCEFVQSRDVSMEIALPATDRPYLLVPRTLQLTSSRGFTLSVFSSIPVGPDVLSIRFVRLPDASPLFADQVEFPYDMETAKLVQCEWQQRTPLCEDGKGRKGPAAISPTYKTTEVTMPTAKAS